MKKLLKSLLASGGWSLQRLRGIVTGVDLCRDLRLVVGSAPGCICIDVGANDGATIDLLQAGLTDP